MILVEEENTASASFCYVCILCDTDIVVPYYKSENFGDGRDFRVHAVCSHLPVEMEHLGHTLFRSELPRQMGVNHPPCSVCSDEYYHVFYKNSVSRFIVCIKCALKSFPITHHCHPQHPLIPIHDKYEPFKCFACKRETNGISYKCTTCAFRVHQECVSSRIVKLPFHHHEVKIIYSLNAESRRSGRFICCQFCKEDMKEQSWAYHCARCKYFFHVYNCRPVVHSSHHHPLVLVEEDANATGFCCGCNMKISPPYYACSDELYVRFSDCRTFFLHKFCAELPQNVKHHLHPGHALTLKDTSQSDQQEFVCNACQEPWKGFNYSCASESCSFTIDMICSTKPLQKHEFHQHRLMSSLLKAPSACRACNTDNEGPSYQCITCRFWVHQQCASVPEFRKIDFHPHDLKLTYSLSNSVPEASKHFHCDVCRKEIGSHNSAYICLGCKFFTHVHNCSDPSRETEEFDHEAALAAAVHLPVANASISLATFFFMDDRHVPFLDPDTTCHACEKQLAAPCNKCSLCKYFLPKCLTKLNDASIFEGFRSMLKGKRNRNCNRFGMSFDEDFLNIKISSSVLPRYIKHEGHNHVLSTTCITEKTWCTACKITFSGYGFRCDICNFTIDMYCALLPGSLHHRYDKKHDFKLTYYSIESVEEYVCEICEGDIKTMWFYHCEDCDYSIHSRCIWKYHIRFGSLFSEKYQQECTLVLATEALPSYCNVCYKTEMYGCRYFFHFDDEPSFVFHLQCMYTKMWRWPKKEDELLSILARVKKVVDLNP